jgi:hypothetical protein
MGRGGGRDLGPGMGSHGRAGLCGAQAGGGPERYINGGRTHY